MNELLKKNIENRANSLYHYFSDLAENQKEPSYHVTSQATKFEFVIRENDEINGKAWCENDVDHVEINSGVIELFYHYFTAVMEHDKVNFLRPLNLDKDESILKEYSYEGIFFNNGIAEIFDSKIIDDGKAKLLGIFTSRFIVLHELGHVFNGHCSFLKNELHIGDLQFIPMYFENTKGQLNRKNALDFRTLEMDADAFAATQSILHVILLYMEVDEQVDVKIDRESLFYWWAFAVHSHFLICEDRFMDQEYNKEMTHLPSSARWCLVCNLTIDVIDLSDFLPEDKEKMKNLIMRGAIDAEIKFNSIKLTNYNWIDETINNFHFIEYTEEVNRNWDKLRDRLQKYARLTLYGKA